MMWLNVGIWFLVGMVAGFLIVWVRREPHRCHWMIADNDIKDVLAFLRWPHSHESAGRSLVNYLDSKVIGHALRHDTASASRLNSLASKFGYKWIESTTRAGWEPTDGQDVAAEGKTGGTASSAAATSIISTGAQQTRRRRERKRRSRA